MNEQQPQPAREPRHREAVAGLERLAQLSSNPEVLQRWESGVRIHGDAFVAYLRLGGPQIYEPDVLTSFENAFIATRESYDVIIEDYLEGMGWSGPLEQLRTEYGIPEEALEWNRSLILEVIREYSYLVEEGDMIHVFGP